MTETNTYHISTRFTKGGWQERIRSEEIESINDEGAIAQCKDIVADKISHDHQEYNRIGDFTYKVAKIGKENYSFTVIHEGTGTCSSNGKITFD